MQETWVCSLSQKTPWRREWLPTPVSLPGESHGQRNLAGYSPWGCKESDTTERLNTFTWEAKQGSYLIACSLKGTLLGKAWLAAALLFLSSTFSDPSALTGSGRTSAYSYWDIPAGRSAYITQWDPLRVWSCFPVGGQIELRELFKKPGFDLMLFLKIKAKWPWDKRHLPKKKEISPSP